MSQYIVKLSNISSAQGAGEYDGGRTLAEARREASFFASHAPRARITINKATREGRLRVVEIYHEPRREGFDRNRERDLYPGASRCSKRDSAKPMKDPATMTAGEINRELDRLDKAQSRLAHEFIRVGRGHERPSETEKLDDPLARKAKNFWKRRQLLSIEIDMRYGPGAPTRLPRGFGPRRR